jgi:hypothetical protein
VSFGGALAFGNLDDAGAEFSLRFVACNRLERSAVILVSPVLWVVLRVAVVCSRSRPAKSGGRGGMRRGDGGVEVLFANCSEDSSGGEGTQQVKSTGRLDDGRRLKQYEEATMGRRLRAEGSCEWRECLGCGERRAVLRPVGLVCGMLFAAEGGALLRDCIFGLTASVDWVLSYGGGLAIGDGRGWGFIEVERLYGWKEGRGRFTIVEARTHSTAQSAPGLATARPRE